MSKVTKQSLWPQLFLRCTISLHSEASLPPKTGRRPLTHIYTPQTSPLRTPDPGALLTESNLGQVQPVDPGDLAQGVGGDEDHHEADGAAGPAVRGQEHECWNGAWLTREVPSSSPQPPALEIERGLCRASKHGQRGQWPGKASVPWGRTPSTHHSPGEGPGNSPERPGHGLQPGPGTRRGCLARPWGVWPSAGCDSRGPPGPHLVRVPQASSDTCTRLTLEPLTRACSQHLAQGTCLVNVS